MELIKQHLKGEAKDTVKFMLTEGDNNVESIFRLLQETYGDKVPIGTRLKDFYDRKQVPGETIRAYAYDLRDVWREECQTALNKLKNCFMSPPILAYPDFQCPFHTYDGWKS